MVCLQANRPLAGEQSPLARRRRRVYL